MLFAYFAHICVRIALAFSLADETTVCIRGHSISSAFAEQKLRKPTSLLYKDSADRCVPFRCSENFLQNSSRLSVVLQRLLARSYCQVKLRVSVAQVSCAFHVKLCKFPFTRASSPGADLTLVDYPRWRRWHSWKTFLHSTHGAAKKNRASLRLEFSGGREHRPTAKQDGVSWSSHGVFSIGWTRMGLAVRLANVWNVAPLAW